MFRSSFARSSYAHFKDAIGVRGKVLAHFGMVAETKVELDSMLGAAEAARDTMIMFSIRMELAALTMEVERDLSKALAHMEEALKLDPDKKFMEQDPFNYLRLAESYDLVKQHRRSIMYSSELLALGERTENTYAQYWGHIYLAAGYQRLGAMDTTALHVEKAIHLLRTTPSDPHRVAAYGLLAGIERQRGQSDRADAMLDSMDLTAQRFRMPLSMFPEALREKAWHALRMGDPQAAAEVAGMLQNPQGHAPRGFAEQYYHQVMDSVCLALGDHRGAYEHHARYEAMRDELDLTSAAARLRSIETNYREEAERAKRRLEEEAAAFALQRERTRRNVLLAAGMAAFLFGFVSYRQRRSTQRALRRSDELLLNILPEEVAEELKTTGAAQAKNFEQATILFTDFKGFTQVSEKLPPAELVAELNTCFKAFDAIMGKYRIEKIKTIGDAYMAAGGVPDPQHGAAADVVRAALEMQEFMKAHKAEREAQSKPYFEMRVGIHTGPVVAGIVGVKKFQYDIWGDTVNTASRMESSGEVGQVNISEATYALVKDETGFTFTPRGKVQAKGKGEMEMYFVGRNTIET
ncbi:MAG TPA: adenylate/guanylate cyclase domain-containing protein [Flavobacteriales bacterium]|nr:adenylate/guanylate cyclase domain-containing protein [Flavobacteriales bacterium]